MVLELHDTGFEFLGGLCFRTGLDEVLQDLRTFSVVLEQFQIVY